MLDIYHLIVISDLVEVRENCKCLNNSTLELIKGYLLQKSQSSYLY